MNLKHIFLSFALITITTFSFAQSSKEIIQNYFNENKSALNLDDQDVIEFVVTDEVYSKSTNVTHVYIQQVYNGIEVFNGRANFNLLDKAVFSMGNRLVSHLSSKNASVQPAFSSSEALVKAVDLLGLVITDSPILIEEKSINHQVYSNSGISLENIPVKLVYIFKDNQLKLAWDLNIYQLDAKDWWSIRLDAVSGEIIEQNNWVKHCDFGEHAHNHDLCNKNSNKSIISEQEQQLPIVGAYNVFAIPTESPNHGGRTLVVNPEDLEASPFGWHDTNGSFGNEFTNTRGNNVYAYEDENDNNSPGFSPEGGSSLNFDFSYDILNNPEDNLTSAITNLFYMNNIMHDVWYQYGFDEASGNFQQNNYGNGGSSSDFVLAEAQDGSGTNNANFATPPDGSNPRMQMYIWGSGTVNGNDFTVNSPPSAINLDLEYLNSLPAFGPDIPTIPITEDLVLVLDGPGDDIYDACQSITNGAALDGKIAVIRRGTCLFVEKIQAAQDEGAVAVIIINNVGGDPVTMGGDSNTITIPSLMLSSGQGQGLINALENGDLVNGTIVQNDDNGGEPDFDSDFDNGIIAHEYGHGISTRLTGGRFNVDCLFNEEQMGEGWSDWFGLMLTIEPGDLGTDIRGIGTYVSGQSITGNGIRPAPYSTNPGINNFTYAATNNAVVSEPHGIGFVWSSMLWDLTWAFIDVYGYDADIYNGTGGNNMVMQLVIDGLKLQACDPGFVDGRDAILEADVLINNGMNQCLIWEVFANRGLGANASQGSPYDRFDQVQDFNMPDDINNTTQNITLCYGETVVVGNEIVDSPGTFVEVIENPNGCDGSITTNVFVLADPSVELDEITLSVTNTSAGASYQWFNCENNTEVFEATSSSFTPQEDGSYYVQISLNNCTNTSECVEVFSVGIREVNDSGLIIYPNPTNDFITIDFGKEKIKLVTLTDARGRLVFNSTVTSNSITIDLSNEENGIYTLRIVKESGVEVKKIMKE